MFNFLFFLNFLSVPRKLPARARKVLLSQLSHEAVNWRATFGKTFASRGSELTSPQTRENRELQQQRQQRQRKLHLKINIWEMVTIL